MPGKELARPATGAHYNLSMRVPKGLGGSQVRKVVTGELFQTPTSLDEANPGETFKRQSDWEKAPVSQNQRPITDLRQGAIVRGDNNQSPVVSGIRNK